MVPGQVHAINTETRDRANILTKHENHVTAGRDITRTGGDEVTCAATQQALV